MRYPSLWEAVQTHWYREEPELSALDGEAPAPLPESRATRPIDASIDGKKRPVVEIDTDPFVYAIGAKLASGGGVTITNESANSINVTVGDQVVWRRLRAGSSGVGRKGMVYRGSSASPRWAFLPRDPQRPLNYIYRVTAGQGTGADSSALDFISTTLRTE